MASPVYSLLGGSNPDFSKYLHNRSYSGQGKNFKPSPSSPLTRRLKRGQSLSDIAKTTYADCFKHIAVLLDYALFMCYHIAWKQATGRNENMHRTTVTLPQELVDDLLSVIHVRNKTQAVILAIREETRRRKLEKIKKMAGGLEFEIEAEQSRHGDERLG